jgi:hypothetical protein
LLLLLLWCLPGEIDTLNEKYQAQLSIESRWCVDVDRLPADLSADDSSRLHDGKSVSLNKYADTHWHPQLYIENALGDLKEQIRYTAKLNRDEQRIYICEHRDVKGLFWEKLELQHFPSDVQDLSISIGSMFYDDKVLLVNDPHHRSGVNRETFVDQQEWSLYEHVDVQQRFVKEFLFRGPDDDDNDDDNDERLKGSNNQQQSNTDSDDRKRSILTVTCHAGQHRSPSPSPSLSHEPTYSRCSSAIELFPMERILSHLSYYSCFILHIRHSYSVRRCSTRTEFVRMSWSLFMFKSIRESHSNIVHTAVDIDHVSLDSEPVTRTYHVRIDTVKCCH